MASKEQSSSDLQYSDEEIARRRDAVVKRMLSMPPKPHSDMKVGKSAKGGKSARKMAPKKVK